MLAAHPPVRWWWTSFLAAPLLVSSLAIGARAWAAPAEPEARLGARRAFSLGFLAGASLFLPLLSWLILPAGYLAWVLLSAIQASFFGLLAVALRPFLASAWLPLLAAVGWTGADAWRAIVPLSGFEWGAIAYAHVEGSWLLPVARLLGGRAITFLVVLIGMAGYVVVRTTVHGLRERESGPVEHAVASSRTPVAVLVAALLISVLATIEPPAPTGSIDVLAVQGNDIRHWEESVPNASLLIATQMRDLTVDAVGDGPAPELTVWPEASVDTDPYSERGRPYRPLLEEAASTSRFLLAGVNIDGPDPSTGFYRTQLLLDQRSRAVDRYDKRAVVPFGEYIPMRSYLGWFPPLAQVPRDILPAEEPHLVEVGDVPVAVLICFETLFDTVTRANVLAGDEPAQLIVAATTDASYGESAEPAQHLDQSRLRAVETGRWVVHAALSGASAFVDPEAGIHDRTSLFTTATIRRDVPTVTGLTPYLVIGDVVGWLTRFVALGLLLVPPLVAVVRRRRGRS